MQTFMLANVMAALCALAFVAAEPPVTPCSTPGTVLAAVCPSLLCGPHGYCLAVQFGGHCSCDADCSSRNCVNGLCEKSRVGSSGGCFSNNDCTNNNCDPSCNKCKPVNAGGACSCNSDCNTQNCDVDAHVCLPSARGGPCGDSRDCYSGVCKNGCCKASAPGLPCTCSGDCDMGGKCLLPVVNGDEADVGTCYLTPEVCCDENSECGTNFCSTSVAFPNKAVCLKGGIGAPCGIPSDCADASSNTLRCVPPAQNGLRGTCAVDLCRLQVCDVHATCVPLGPFTYSCFCISGYTGSGLNTGDQLAPGCVGFSADRPEPLSLAGPPVQQAPFLGSPCVQHFECGSNNCSVPVGGPPGVCVASPTGICQHDNDCPVGKFCDLTPNDHIYTIGQHETFSAGHCRVNECLTRNGGCHEMAACTPKHLGGVECTCPPGTFGSGKAKKGDHACENPCSDHNGGCGAPEAGTCTPVSKDDVTCTCNPGWYLTSHGCVDPCLHHNGGCNLFEICTSTGPDDEQVNCRCRDGFFIAPDGETCLVDVCFGQCLTDQTATCEAVDGHPVCNCPAGRVWFVPASGTPSCVQDHCQNTPAVCDPKADCKFYGAGGQHGFTGQVNIDTTTNCTCRAGYIGNGYAVGTGTGNGCTALQCPPADVSSIDRATRGNCDGNQWTGDRCVLGCITGYRPSDNPHARCIGQSPYASLIEYRPFHCEREDEDEHHSSHGDHHDHDDQIGWTCEITPVGGSQCVPQAPTVAWKQPGKIGLHWTALGKGVTRLVVKFAPAADPNGMPSTTADIPNPGFATSTQIVTGLVAGKTYGFWLEADYAEGSTSATYIGKVLYAKVLG